MHCLVANIDFCPLLLTLLENSAMLHENRKEERKKKLPFSLLMIHSISELSKLLLPGLEPMTFQSWIQPWVISIPTSISGVYMFSALIPKCNFSVENEEPVLVFCIRSEIHNPAVMVQYSLILECYLRANKDHLEELYRQKEALSKLTFVNQLVKMDRYKFDDQVSNKNELLISIQIVENGTLMSVVWKSL